MQFYPCEGVVVDELWALGVVRVLSQGNAVVLGERCCGVLLLESLSLLGPRTEQ